MARGKETEFTNYFRKTIREGLGAFAYKIPDDNSNTFKMARPFDLVACLKGKAIAIEFKWKAKPSSINQKTLSGNQHEALKEFEEAGGLALVGLFVKVKRGDVRLLIWTYSDFVARGRVLAREQIEEPYIGYTASTKRFDAQAIGKTFLDLENGF